MAAGLMDRVLCNGQAGRQLFYKDAPSTSANGNGPSGCSRLAGARKYFERVESFRIWLTAGQTMPLYPVRQAKRPRAHSATMTSCHGMSADSLAPAYIGEITISDMFPTDLSHLSRPGAPKHRRHSSGYVFAVVSCSSCSPRAGPSSSLLVESISNTPAAKLRSRSSALACSRVGTEPLLGCSCDAWEVGRICRAPRSFQDDQM